MKNYLEKNLMPNEKVIASAKFTKAMFIVPAILLLGAFITIKTPDGFLGYLVLAIITSLPGLYYNVANTLAVTNRNIVGKAGLIKQTQLASPINQVQNVQVANKMLGKIFRYGTVNITTTSGIYSFKYVSKPNEFKNAVLSQISMTEEDKMDLHAQKIAQAINNNKSQY